MAKLHYLMLMSLDGYAADEEGNFDWAEPDEEVHAFVNDLERPVGTYLLGRRMYEVLAVWDTLDLADQPSVIKDFAGIWRTTDKIVYSSKVDTASTSRTRIESRFDPAAVRQMKTSATRDLMVGGPHLAGQAIAAGLVDEIHLFLAPILVGGGTRALADDVRVELELLDERRFDGGMVYLRHGTKG